MEASPSIRAIHRYWQRHLKVLDGSGCLVGSPGAALSLEERTVTKRGFGSFHPTPRTPLGCFCRVLEIRTTAEISLRRKPSAGVVDSTTTADAGIEAEILNATFDPSDTSMDKYRAPSLKCSSPFCFAGHRGSFFSPNQRKDRGCLLL